MPKNRWSLLPLRRAGRAGSGGDAEQLIAAIEAEQERLSLENYLMDSDECVKVIREEIARLNGVKM